MRWDQKEELRQEFSLLKDLMEIKIAKGVSRKQRLKSVENFKKRIREKLKQYNEVDDIHYSEDGESCYYKEWFNYSFTEEDKQEFIEDSWVHINFPWSPTGQWFTRNIVVCNVNGSENGKAVAYIFMSLDC